MRKARQQSERWTQGGFTPEGDGLIRLDRAPRLPGLGVLPKPAC
jgi:hypothetical protein